MYRLFGYNRRIPKAILLGIFTLFSFIEVSAYDFQYGGIYYNILEGNTVEVTSGDAKYEGNIVIPSSVTYNSKSYSVKSIGSNAFNGCVGMASVTIPNTITSIGAYAFYDCRILTSITIPNSVSTIESSTFSECIGLTSVIIPNSVKSIESNAFNDCAELTSVTIPNSVKKIGYRSFAWCRKLSSISIPNSVESIAYRAFYGCSSLASITFPNSLTNIGDEAFNGTPWYNDQPDGLIYAGSVAYKYKGTMPENTSIVIKEGTSFIRDSVFRGCSGLKSITIPNSVTSIGISAFYGCNGLLSVTIPNSVKSIAYRAFCGCSSLSSFIISNSMTVIEEEIFASCKALSSIVIPNSVTEIGKKAFEGCSSLASITIPNSVKVIRNNAFSGCSSLTSITIPGSLTVIEEYTFSSCSGLTYISIPNSVTSIAYEAFRGCSGLTSITISNSVKSIGNRAFYGCSSLASITIPNSVKSIGNRAFYGCSSLASITIPNYLSIIGNEAFDGTAWYNDQPDGLVYIGNVLYKYKGTMPANTEIFINEGTLSINGYAFNNCSGLTAITIPNSVTSIGLYAFGNCSGLTTISIPKSLDIISQSMFYNCKSLNTIKIPNSVTKIEYGAFRGCTGLTTIISEIAVPFTIGYDVFSDYSTPTLIVPKGTKLAYQSTTGWNKFEKIVEADSNSNGEWFKLPAGYTEVEYIQAPKERYSGSQAWTVPNNLQENYNYIFEFTPLSWEERYYGHMIGGNDQGTDSPKYRIFKLNSAGFDAAFWNYDLSTNHPSTGANYRVYTGLRSKIQMHCKNYDSSKGAEILVDNEGYATYTHTSMIKYRSGYIIQPGIYDIPLFSTINGNTEPAALMQLHNFKVEDKNGNAVYDYVPCKRNNDSKVGLYDLVNGAFYYPSAFDLTAGPEVQNSSTKRTIHVATAGTLPNLISESEKYTIEELTLTGELNGTDFRLLRDMAGCNYLGDETQGNLTALDISGARIVAGGEKYVDTDNLPGSGGSFRYTIDKVDELPQYVFAGCKFLSISLPSTINKIAESALSNCYSLTSITIPNSVTSIGVGAFWNCSSLVSITIPESVTSIGQYAYRGTGWYKKQGNGILYIDKWLIDYKGDKPIGKTYIEEGTIGIAAAFCNCSGLTSVTIPNSVTYIGDRAFSYCTGLTSVTIPNSVTIIGDGAFDNCTGLTSMTIPNSVNSIGDEAFSGCIGLTSVTINKGVIGEWAFKKCSGLTKVTIGDGVTTIGTGAFYYCYSLNSLIIGDYVVSIGDEAFSRCSSLTSLTIPNSVISIGVMAFNNCPGLTSLTIGGGVSNIGDYAFYKSANLQDIVSDIKVPFEIEENVFSVYSTAKLTVPKGTRSAYQSTSSWNKFSTIVEAEDGNVETEVTFASNGITYKGTIATQLGEVTAVGSNSKNMEIPSSVTYDGKSYSVTSIKSGALDGLSLNYLSIPSSITSLDNTIFSRCDLGALIWNANIALSSSVFSNAKFSTSSNFLLYVNSVSYAPSNVKNVVVGTSANTILLSDNGGNFYCPKEFTAQTISYTHNYSMTTGGNGKGWETLALPFDVQKIEHKTKGTLTPFAAYTGSSSQRPFWLYEFGSNGFKRTDAIKANTPYIISMPNSSNYDSEYILAGDVTFSASNVKVVVTSSLEIASSGSKFFKPAFSMTEKASVIYPLNVSNSKVSNSSSFDAGSRFISNLRAVYPFEAYISTSSSNARTITIEFDDDATGIDEIPQSGQSNRIIKVYSLTGLLLFSASQDEFTERWNDLPSGVYIVNGQKMIKSDDAQYNVIQ